MSPEVTAYVTGVGIKKLGHNGRFGRGRSAGGEMGQERRGREEASGSRAQHSMRAFHLTLLLLITPGVVR